MVEDDIWLEGKEKIFYIVPIAVLALTLGVWIQNPSVAFQLEAGLQEIADKGGGSLSSVGGVASSGVPVYEDRDLKISQDDVLYMNRIFRETSHESAYCGTLDTDYNIQIWKADTVNASEDNIWYDVGNCPSSYNDILIHTHPASSSTDLSDTDKVSFLDSPFTYSCIQAGYMADEPGTTIGAFECYDKEEAEDMNSTFRSHDVVVAGGE